VEVRGMSVSQKDISKVDRFKEKLSGRIVIGPRKK